jgi:DNA polymerase III delta prime subunit
MSGLFDKMWVEKYRPKTLDDYLCDEETMRYLQSMVESQSFQNIMLCGIQGIGKTSLAKLIVTHLVPCDYLYINASNERGIDAIRGKVQSFVETKSFEGKIKAVILDEAHGLTVDAQRALNAMTEEFSDTARFILTANEKNKIIASIQSRFHSVELYSEPKTIYKRLLYILNEECIEIGHEEKKFLVEIIKNFNPDIRHMINHIQSCVEGSKLNINAVNSFTKQYIMSVFEKISEGTRAARAYILNTEKNFGGDYPKLLHSMAEYIYNDESIKNSDLKLVIINNYLDKSSRIIDQELNAYCCIIELRSLDTK